MKRTSLLLLAVAGLLMCSCSYSVYMKGDLEYNYLVRMQSKSELETRSRIPIYYSENEVPGPYELIAYVMYRPFFQIPLIYTGKAQQTKKFLKKAVTKTEDMGGNAVLVLTVGSFKVIKVTEQLSDGTVKNPIFNTIIMDKFANGGVNRDNMEELKREMNNFMKEIGNNIKGVTTREELEMVDKKIEVLNTFNESLKKRDRFVHGFCDDYQGVFRKAALKRVEVLEKNADKIAKAKGKVDAMKQKAEKKYDSLRYGVDNGDASQAPDGAVTIETTEMNDQQTTSAATVSEQPSKADGEKAGTSTKIGKKKGKSDSTEKKAKDDGVYFNHKNQ